MNDEAIPAGLCQCGCGGTTRQAPYTSARVGWVRGEWTKFLLGHNNRTTPRYEVDPQSGCWNTLGGKTKTGYGKITNNRRTFLLHRWMYEQVIGPIPAGKQLHHLCQNEACCNPAHLIVVSLIEHRALDSAKLTEANIREIILLQQAGITRTELAKSFGVTVSAIRDIFSGKRHTTAQVPARQPYVKRRKLTLPQVRAIRMLGDTTPHADIAERFGISVRHVRGILNDETWKDDR